MLSLIGLGLHDEKDISLRGLERAENSDRVFLEKYTSQWKGRKGLEEVLDRKVEVVERSDLEEESDRITGLAGEEDVAVLIPGDPLVATTHTELLIQARKKGIETEVIHSSSIYSAVTETGLQIYKFGKTTTIPFPRENYRPESPYDAIKENKERGLHTLTLLDIKDGEGMKASRGLEYLLEIEEERGGDVISLEKRVVALSLRGGESSIEYGPVKELLEGEFSTPAALVFPGELHEKEREALEMFAGR
ncbi:MAG: diphthine synthase [Candidatus Aenigmatarchaeota archaeon]